MFAGCFNVLDIPFLKVGNVTIVIHSMLIMDNL